MTVPPEAITAAAVAIHDADCPDRTCSGSALGHCYKLASVALEAAVPLIVAEAVAPLMATAERNRIRQRVPAAMNALAVHRWKTMGTGSVECECGEVVHGDADPFPADEAFRRHLAEAMVADLLDADR